MFPRNGSLLNSHAALHIRGRTFCNAIGQYAHIRKHLDYRYHSRFSIERQKIQDGIVEDLIRGSSKKNSTRPPPMPWLVYSAGPMGAGKSHTLRWLEKRNLFPLQDFVYLDPDAIKYRLPEWVQLRSSDPHNAATLAHKESGYICEIAERRACELGRCVLVDGSLRDYEWYKKEFRRVRAEHPEYKIAIIHVMASKNTVIRRAERRANVTGRSVPLDLVLLAYEQVPFSVAQLAPLADYVVHIDNDGNQPIILPPADPVSFGSVWTSSGGVDFNNYCSIDQRQWVYRNLEK